MIELSVVFKLILAFDLFEYVIKKYNAVSMRKTENINIFLQLTQINQMQVLT